MINNEKKYYMFFTFTTSEGTISKSQNLEENVGGLFKQVLSSFFDLKFHL